MENLENIQDSDVATTNTNETFPLVSTSKTKTTKVESKYYANEAEIVSKASKAPHHLVCAAYGITQIELNEILSRNNSCNC